MWSSSSGNGGGMYTGTRFRSPSTHNKTPLVLNVLMHVLQAFSIPHRQQRAGLCVAMYVSTSEAKYIGNYGK